MIDYSSLLSEKVQEIKPSGIRKFSELAAEMGNVISLGVGEPDFQTPWAIRQAGIESLERGRTHYSPNAGFRELKQEIDRYLERRMGLSYSEEETMVTIGGSEAIDMMIRAVIDPGDEVLTPSPAMYPMIPCPSDRGEDCEHSHPVRGRFPPHCRGTQGSYYAQEQAADLPLSQQPHRWHYGAGGS